MNKLVSFLFFLCFGIACAQQTEYVDFISVKADLELRNFSKVSGFVFMTFKIKKATDSVFIDAIDMKFRSMSLISKSEGYLGHGNYENNGKKIKLLHDFKKNNIYTIHFWYSAKPKKALYFVDNQIWTQGQGKYTSNWLPSIDDMNDKVEFDLSISYDKNYKVISNGVLVKKENKVSLNDSLIEWQFNMNKPMSSYLVALAIGNYNKKTETSKGGIPLEYYYYPEDSLKVEPTYRYSKQMFDFLEEEIGVPYPWEIYKQVPVKDFLYSGMENTTLTIFSDAFVVDSIGFNDRNYVNVNAHELAHQWFGNLATETSGTHHWLQEGFATYYALLAESDVFGDAYYYWKLYEYAQQLLEQEKAGESTSLLDPKSSSLTFYQKGCWALHVLKEQIGADAFKDAVKNYLLKYEYKNVETSNFIKEAERASGQDLSTFVATWLEAVDLPQDVMVKSLKKSEFIEEYLNVDCDSNPSKCQDYLVSDISDKAKVKILSQKSYSIKNEDFRNSWEVRQAIAQNLIEIPRGLKENYESLLRDKSYITIEHALYNLWVNFPEERVRYLQQTKGIIGFNDYNVKLLWLALHLNTIEYQPDQKQAVFDELKGCTSPEYGFELRMNAFNYLKLINGFDEDSIQNLIDAKNHHNWRFQQFAKSLLEELNLGNNYKLIIDKLSKSN